MILSEVIWFNSNIKSDNNPTNFSFFSYKSVDFIGQWFNDNGNVKPWKDLKIEFHLKDIYKIYWLQIIDAFSKTWEDIILKDKGNARNLIIFDHHVEILKYIVEQSEQNYFENIFETSQFNRKKYIYFSS